MIKADTIVYNNLPIDVRLGDSLRPRATPNGSGLGNTWGVKEKLYQLPVDKFRDNNRTIHSANFLNTNGEILPCYISPSLKLNQVYSDNPNANTNVYQAKYGNARNQGMGIATDKDQMKLFKKTNFIPNLTSAGITPNHFSKKQ